VSLEAFALSTGAVALGEVGDKTQLLALLLVARYRQPWTILAGIALATLLNHLLAAYAGQALALWLGPYSLRWLLGSAFIAVALWLLWPDEAGGLETMRGATLGVFGITTISFFFAEMGDKTQVATVVLAARYGDALTVTAGSVLGLLLANAPVLWLGDRLLRRVPIAWVHRVAAALFALMGLALLLGVANIPA
jgi:putative Ca2+/H+ antiporter (TMEM165/GDT1 family)